MELIRLSGTQGSVRMPGHMAASSSRRKSAKRNVVERAIAVATVKKEGDRPSASEFARMLSRQAGYEISRQAVHNWKKRGNFSRDVVVHVHALTNIPLVELIDAPFLRGRE